MDHPGKESAEKLIFLKKTGTVAKTVIETLMEEIQLTLPFKQCSRSGKILYNPTPSQILSIMFPKKRIQPSLLKEQI